MMLRWSSAGSRTRDELARELSVQLERELDTLAACACRREPKDFMTITEGAAGIGWEVPRADVLATIREAFGRYDVTRAYFDTQEWSSDIDALAISPNLRDKIKAALDNRQSIDDLKSRIPTNARAASRMRPRSIGSRIHHTYGLANAVRRVAI